MMHPQLRLQQLYVQHPANSNSAMLDKANNKIPLNKKFALQHIDIDISQGEQIAIIGPSGAGKTTLLHTLACAYRPSAGIFTMNGKAPWALTNTERHRQRRHLFLAPQTPPLPPRQRVVTAVLAGRLPNWSITRALRNLIKPIDPAAAYQALSRFHLQDKLYTRVDQLSGGERQRCGLARLLLSDAQLLLVDEPLSALDPLLAIQTLDTLQQEARDRNATLICSLHQIELARSKFSRIIGLRDGRIFFDSNQVDDQMIANLYQNSQPETPEASATTANSTPEPTIKPPANPRCF